MKLGIVPIWCTYIQKRETDTEMENFIELFQWKIVNAGKIQNRNMKNRPLFFIIQFKKNSRLGI